MIKLGTDYQAASTLIGIGCCLTITADVARKFEILKSDFFNEKVHLMGDTMQNFALIAYVALPLFRNLIQTEPLVPLQIVCLALATLGSLGLGKVAFVIATGGVKKNDQAFEFLNVFTKVANMAFLYWTFQQKALGKHPALILGAPSLSSILITISRVC